MRSCRRRSWSGNNVGSGPRLRRPLAASPERLVRPARLQRIVVLVMAAVRGAYRPDPHIPGRQRIGIARQAAAHGLGGLAARDQAVEQTLRCQRIEGQARSEEHTSELQSQSNLVCRLLLEKKKKNKLT